MRKLSTFILIFILSFSMSTFLVSPTNAAENSWTTLASLPPPHNTIRFGAAVAMAMLIIFGSYQAVGISFGVMSAVSSGAFLLTKDPTKNPQRSID